jgi:hypothetical protein
MNQLIWKSEKEMQDELKKEIKEYKPGRNRDGRVIAAEGKFIYRGIAYLIKVLRYYNHDEGFTTMGRDRISDCHAVVEYPDETIPIVNLIPNDYGSEFLYHDTLHSWNDKQTTEQQIEICHKWAKEDIDNLLDGEIAKRIDEGIKKLQEAKDNLMMEANKIK